MTAIPSPANSPTVSNDIEVVLSDQQLERLAELLAERLRGSPSTRTDLQPPENFTGSFAGLVDAATLASELGVSRQWIYQHRDRLGGVRIGTGPRARIRFDVNTARQALHAPERTTTPTTTSRRRTRTNEAGSILKVRQT
jgi:hypothetical protein